jgi:AraC family transcriptional regulator, regulatory protein of adaptative response / DNA-3-methyladenine glycosylase II
MEVELYYRPPLDWQAMIGFLGARAIPGVEAVDERRYRRSVDVGGRPGAIELRHLPGERRLVLAIHPRSLARGDVVERARRLFDLDANPAAISAALAEDPVLRPLVRARPGLRVPGSWSSYELAVRAVLGQQVSVAHATALAGRLAERLGRRLPLPTPPGLSRLFPAPHSLAGADVASAGMPRARANTIIQIAARAAAGNLPDDLEELPGIGPWTAAYVAMRSGDPDAFPAGDLGLRRALGNRVSAAAEAWRPWRAYAAMHIWMGYPSGAGATTGAPSAAGALSLPSTSSRL